MTTLVELRRGAYHDSVSLMRVSQAVTAMPGTEAALVAMATPLNRDLAVQMGFAVPDGSSANDLLVALRASDDAALEAARRALEDELAGLSRPPAGTATEEVAGTLGTAAAASAATVALISVPGEHAFTEAVDALDAGLHVMLFSDNVPVSQEIALKDLAADRGLLVMGPDCGTAIIGGVGLGFANAVSPGPIGVVAASGTGAQQLSCLLDAAGVGVSHVLGVGGRDLSAAVAGRSTLRALAALGADAATETVVVVSKPAAAEVAAMVQAAAAGLGKPVVMAVLGQGHEDLTAAAEKALATVGVPVPPWPAYEPDDRVAPEPGALRGLFSGGTLCDEAMAIATDALGPVRSNIPLRPELALGADLRAVGHAFVDFGDDRLTQGRPHPMVDHTLRVARLAEELADPAVSVVLLDVVLGHGAHADPAGTLAPAVADGLAAARASGRQPAVVVSLCGARRDPQGLDAQAAALRDAGAWVCLSNAGAARRAVVLTQGGLP